VKTAIVFDENADRFEMKTVIFRVKSVIG